MTAPFFDVAPAITAIPVGLAFGVALERSGLGLPRTIAAQLDGRDFTVLKVMFSAIVTAMLGLFWAERLGWLDVTRLALPPTDSIPQLVGAVVFGAGFAIAALCPGTACVAAGTGRRDGFAVIGGLFLGTLVTMELWPKLGRIAENVLRPEATLPADLGMSKGLVVALITGVALASIAGGGWIERRLGTARVAAPARGTTVIATAAVTLAILAALTSGSASTSGASLRAIASEIATERDHLDPVELAEWLHDRRPGLRVIDVREDSVGDAYEIPGSTPMHLADVPSLQVAPGETVVLYSAGGTHAAQAWVLLRARGVQGIRILRDGLAGWEEEVLSPTPPPPGDSVAAARYDHIKSLSKYFGGRPAATDAPTGGYPPPGGVPLGPKKLRRNTC